MTQSLIEPNRYDVIVVGGGPAGLAAALAVAGTGAQTALVARKVPYADNRTTALLGDSIDLLEKLGVWGRCASKAAALCTMRLVDDTSRLIRAPEVRFNSSEIGMDAFGYNIENRNLMVALEAAAEEIGSLDRFDDEAESVAPREDVVVRTRQGQTLAGRLVIGADGRHSPCREAAGITVRSRPLNQSALTFNITTSRPHNEVSTEFHTPEGPCVFVPLPGRRMSIVWVASPKEAQRLMALSDEELSAAAEKPTRFSARSASSKGATCSPSPSRSRAPTAAIALSWPAKPRTSCRRLGRRGSIWGCAMPGILPISSRTRWRGIRIPAAMRSSRDSAARGAPTSPAGPSRSTWPTAPC